VLCGLALALTPLAAALPQGVALGQSPSSSADRLPAAAENRASIPSADIPPVVSLNLPSTQFLGEDVTFTVTFDNENSVPGYGPIVDLIIPSNGADGAQNTNPPLDGLTFVSAAYLGVTVEATAQTFPGSGAVTCVNHPYIVDNTGAPVQVCGDAGDTFVALRLPFGSFTPDQPPLSVQVTLSMSDLADLGVPLTVQARGGYQFGYTPENDFCCGDDPSLTLSSFVNSSVTPTVMTLDKSYAGPANTSAETATGPNFARQYTVAVDIAQGQTITNLTITDSLPNNEQYVPTATASPGGYTLVDEPVTGAAQNPPDNDLVVRWSSVTGGAGANDASTTFSFFVPRDLASPPGGRVIDATTGNSVSSCNDASVSGTWTPIDPRDLPASVQTIDPGGCEHTLTDRSVATQKDVSYSGTLAPGTTMVYTIQVQASDFFAFDGLSLTDVISDGQHFDAGFTPTMAISGNGFSLSAAGMTNYTVVSNKDLTDGPPPPPPENPATDGTTTVTFAISSEQALRANTELPAGLARNHALAGRLLGGCVPLAGSASPDCGSYDDGGTTVTITFQTVVDEDFTDDYPSGDWSVDQGDILRDRETVIGNVLDTLTFAATGSTEDDDATTSRTIDTGSLAKSIYAVNGTAPIGSPIRVKPGDTVTYRITYVMPTSDEENLEFTDYLPLPIFDATEITNFDNVGQSGQPSVIPAAAHANFGPTDTFFTYSGISPTLTTNSTNNRVDFFYGDYDDLRDQSTTVDLLFTVTVSAEPFADGLYLTNQAHAIEGSTNGGEVPSDSIVQLVLTEPVLTTTKSVVATDNPSPGVTFTPSLPIAFSAPGSSGPRWLDTINSNLLASTPIDSDISGVDANDLITFAILVENSGSSINGAFDIVLQDVFDSSAFEFPTIGDAASLNLQVYYGNGTGPIPYDGLTSSCSATADGDPCGGDLFEDGIKLVDPVGEGVCSKHDPNLGNNVIVITYDLRVKSDIAPGTYTNTGSLVNYSGSEGGPNFLPEPDEDEADVTTDTPDVAKARLGTEINDSTNNDTEAVIGELITYRTTLTIPEGTTPDAELVDTLDTGLAFVDCLSVTRSSSDLTTDFGAGDFSDVCNMGTNPSISSVGGSAGRRATWDLGTITNANTDNATAETLTFDYRVVVLDISGNQAGSQRNNAAVFNWTGGSDSASAPNTRVLEPTVNTTKSVLPTSADAGDTVTFTVTQTNPNGANDTTAYDGTWSDTVPSGMTYVPSSLTLGACAAVGVSVSDGSAPTLTASWTSMAANATCSYTFQATVDYSVIPGQQIVNTAETRWTSLPGTVTDRSSFNTSSDERTGAGGLLGGGALDDYRTQGTATLGIAPTQHQKYLFATSEDHTGSAGGTERVAIGEIVRYRLVVTLPEGTSPNFQVQDSLPPGLTFLNDGTAKAAFVSDSGITSSDVGTLPVPGITDPDCNLTGNAADGTSPAIPSDCSALADGNVGSSNSTSTDDDTYNTGTDPFIKLGSLTNTDSDSDPEYIIIEFNALVDNTPGGSNDAGDTLTDNFSVFINGSQVDSASNDVDVGVGEPLLTLNKDADIDSSADAGDSATYTLTITAASGNTRATAFELSLTDTLDASLIPGTVDVTSTQGATCLGGTPFSSSGGFVGQLLSVTATCLDPGESITVTVGATVVDDVSAGYTIPNTGRVTWTSLPGSGTVPNATGSTTPGGSGASDGERNGSGGINNYASTSSAPIDLTRPEVDKLDPDPSSYAIGEQVTFDIRITLPEGVTQDMEVVDDLPSGLSYVSHQVITTAAASGGLLTADFNGTLPSPTVTAPGGSGNDLTLTFGDTTTDVDNDSNNDAFLVRVIALVLNEAGNQNGVDLTNIGELNYTRNGSPATESDSTVISIVEPELNITKAADDDTPGVGQTYSYTLTVEHLPASSADAFDLTIDDPLPTNVSRVSGPSVTSSPGSCAGAVTDNTVGDTISLTIASLPLGCTLSAAYDAQIASPPAAPGDSFDNTAALTWTSLSGSDANERTGAGGVDDYADDSTKTVTFTAVELELTKDDGGVTVQPGDTLSYTLDYQNAGNSLASGVVISETVPDNTTFNAGASSAGWSCAGGSPAGTSCQFSVGDVDIGESGSVTFAVTIDNPVPAGITQIDNTASIADDGSHGSEADLANNSDDETTPLTAVPDLRITKDDGVTIVSPGTTLTYTLTIENVGNQGATGVEVTDTIPTNTTYVSSSASGSESGGVVSWPAFDLAAGDAAIFTVAVDVDDPFPVGVTTIVNTAHVEDDGANGPEPTPGDNAAADTDNVVTSPNSDLTKSVSSTNQAFTTDPMVAIGEIVTYDIVFTVPPGTMSSLNLTDVLNRGLTFLDCQAITPSISEITTSIPGGFDDVCANPTVSTEPSGSLDPADPGRRAVFGFGDVANSGTSSGTVTVSLRAAVLDSIENQDGVALNDAAELNWSSGTLEASTTDLTIVEPDMVLEKTADRTTALPGSVITFTLTLGHTDDSNVNAYDVILSDEVPVGLTYVPGSLVIVSGPAGGVIDDSAAPDLSVTWASSPLLTGVDRTQAVVQFQATMGDLEPGESVTNTGALEWSTIPGDVSSPQSTFNDLSTERRYDPTAANPADVYNVESSVVIRVPHLPGTGFAPGEVTPLPEQPVTATYAELGRIWLDIPRLGLQLPIVGIPLNGDSWDLSWLADQVGWLEGTAFPTWAGNSALTAHVYRADGLPGPFVDLGSLRWGDEVIVHLGGASYVYETRQVTQSSAYSLSSLRHEDRPWLTLITCADYDPRTGNYRSREIVRAVLTEIR
jgi:LPXTG-site transpeptidase (sortase) family protein